MPRAAREAEVIWEGSSARGRGSITAATSGVFAGLPFSEPTRIGPPEGETSPEELIAAAHAACYAMSLAAELTRMKSPPERLTVRAEVVIDEVVDTGHRIVSSALTVRGVGIPSEAIEAADAGCPVSALIRASAEVTVELEEVG
jgi:osmotically inducible protein OsmC